MSSRVIAAAVVAALSLPLVLALPPGGPFAAGAAAAAPAERSDKAKPTRKKTTERPPGAPAAAKRSIAAPAPVPVDVAGMRTAQTRLAFRLVEALQKETPEAANLVVSPGSLAMVATLIALGADAPLQAALARTLGFVDGGGAAAPAAAAPEKAARETKSKKPRKGDKAAVAAAAPPVDFGTVRAIVAAVQADQSLAEVLAVADAIWIDPAMKPRQAVLAAVAEAGGEVFREPLGTPESLARINAWVGERTRGAIPAMLERVPADPGLVAVNALYFKDRWRTAFAPGRTRPAPFTRADGSTVEVPLMTGAIEAVPMRSDDDFVAIELGYATPRFGLVLLGSKDKPLPASGFAPVADWLSGRDFAAATVDVALPRLALAERSALLPALDALGLKAGRVSPTALDGFGPGQRIAEVIQRTVLKIDEAGTEAAAATAVTTVRSALRSQNSRAVFDKPFWFALRDRDTGVVLLAGYVGDPGRAVATAAAPPAPEPAVAPAEAAPAPPPATDPPPAAEPAPVPPAEPAEAAPSQGEPSQGEPRR